MDWWRVWHCSDVIMRAMAFQITADSIACLTVCSGAEQGKHQSSASLAFVMVTGRFSSQRASDMKMFPFHDAIMESMTTYTNDAS